MCRPTGDKRQSKTLFLSIFDRCSSIVKSVFNCRLSDVHMGIAARKPILGVSEQAKAQTSLLGYTDKA